MSKALLKRVHTSCAESDPCLEHGPDVLHMRRRMPHMLAPSHQLLGGLHEPGTLDVHPTLLVPVRAPALAERPCQSAGQCMPAAWEHCPRKRCSATRTTHSGTDSPPCSQIKHRHCCAHIIDVCLKLATLGTLSVKGPIAL